MVDKIDSDCATRSTPQTREVQREQTGKALGTIAPKFIKVVITEEDRQNADAYYINESCLICTALRRKGFAVRSVGGSFFSLGDETYVFDFDSGSPYYLEENASARTNPFYLPSVVGKVISATRLDVLQGSAIPTQSTPSLTSQ